MMNILSGKPILCSLLAAFLWGLWAVGAKFSADRIGFFNSSLFYVLFSFLTVMTVYSISGIHMPKLAAPATMIAMATGVAGGIALICFQAAIQSGYVSTVVPLTSLYPVIPAIYGVAMLGEDITPVKIVGILLAILAAILLSL
jgi:transporter family protein